MQARIEELAPGFGSRIMARRVLGPRELESRDANLIGGAINGGTAQLHQELIFGRSRARAAPRRPSGASTCVGFRPPRRRGARRARHERGARGGGARADLPLLPLMGALSSQDAAGRDQT